MADAPAAPKAPAKKYLVTGTIVTGTKDEKSGKVKRVTLEIGKPAKGLSEATIEACLKSGTLVEVLPE